MSLQCQPSTAPAACRKNYKSIPLKPNPAPTYISGSAPPLHVSASSLPQPGRPMLRYQASPCDFPACFCLCLCLYRSESNFQIQVSLSPFMEPVLTSWAPRSSPNSDQSYFLPLRQHLDRLSVLHVPFAVLGAATDPKPLESRACV